MTTIPITSATSSGVAHVGLVERIIIRAVALAFIMQPANVSRVTCNR